MSLANAIQTQKAIAHPIRLRILSMLREGPLCGCQISAVVKLAASTVSEHLSELKKAGLVAEKKDGRWVEYRLAASGSAGSILETLFTELDSDPEVRADQVLTKALRRVPLEELCGVGNDLSRLDRPAVANAVERSERIREETGA
jgi:ArsR family transcriptional regulator, arsenate/arsenite/antimonite-responsive transcriptional repressor